jgi:molecular chaperone HtpG
MSEEKLSFQAEVSRLLDIVANALYSNKEIFLRELISNASDACDRLRYLGLTDPSLTAADPELAIVLASDKKTGTLTITDNGVGMNREEMVEREFSIAESDAAPPRGTRITLHIKKDQKEFLDPTRLRQVIKTYSDHIAVPIRLDEEEGSINAASALWSRPKSEITDEQYKEFYHHVAHAFDEPWLRLHFKAEGVIEYTGLLFVPSSKPFDLFHPDRKGQIKLYVRRVFITDDCEELLPAYLRFLRGVIDSEDLPLNISRELLQHNPMLTKIKKGVTKRVLGELKKKADKDPEAYATFWDNFGAVLKEGIYEDEGERERLLELARFPSTGTEGPTSLADYVSRMKDGQEAIYYISGEDRETLLKSPQLEGFRAKGVEVLLFSDPVDDFWPTAVPTYADKPFKSVTRGGADLDKVQSAETKDDKEKAEDEGAIGTLLTFVKLALKDQVKDVRASQRLTKSPVCLVADDGELDMHLERVLKQHKQLDQTAPRVLELNPGHPLIKRLAEAVGNDAANANVEDAAHLLLDQARILEGETLPDPTAFSRRLASFMERGVV